MASSEAKALLLEAVEEDSIDFGGLELKLTTKIINDNLHIPNLPLESSSPSSQKRILTPLLYCLSSFFLVAGSLYVLAILAPSWWTSDFLNNNTQNQYEVAPTPPPPIVTNRPARVTSCSSHICKKAAADMRTWMNLSVDPCENFYKYSCDGWIERNPIPSGESSWNVMAKLDAQNRDIIRKELERKGWKKSTKNGAEDKAKIFYASCLHAKQNEKVSDQVLQSVPVWRTCFDETEQYFGLALGAMYVRQSFHQKRKQKASTIVKEVRQALLDILENLNWMDDETKLKSTFKVITTSDQLGYQDMVVRPQDLDNEYKDVEVDEWDYEGNSERLSVRILTKILKNGPGSLWRVTPETVNAFYSTVNNQVVIPAGILQRPFYHPGLPDSVNFGAVGVVIGHELLHAFDDGYDAGDSLSPNRTFAGWWTNQTVDQFTEKAKCLVRQYSSLNVNGQSLNGRQTLDENVADQGGLRTAFRAFRNRKSRHEQQQQLGLTGMVEVSPEQMFFISYAQTWCSASTKASLTWQIDDGTHAPDSARVLGSLQNLAEFSEAFHCRVNSNMNPAKKCIVW